MPALSGGQREKERAGQPGASRTLPGAAPRGQTGVKRARSRADPGPIGAWIVDGCRRDGRGREPRSAAPGAVFVAVAASSSSIGELSGSGSPQRAPNAPPFAPKASHVDDQPGVRTRPLAYQGLYRCGTVPDSHRTSLGWMPPQGQPGHQQAKTTQDRLSILITQSGIRSVWQTVTMHLVPVDRAHRRIIDEQKVCDAIDSLADPGRRSRPGPNALPCSATPPGSAFSSA